jgi:diketogulonate reductase-like aldo/keto reductase
VPKLLLTRHLWRRECLFTAHWSGISTTLIWRAAAASCVVRRAGECSLGRLIECELRPHREKLIITTRAGGRSWPGPYGAGGSRKHILASLDQTLGPLGLDHVDILCAGPFDDGTPLEETMGAIHDAVQQGNARYVGASSYSSSQTSRAMLLLDPLGVPLSIHHAASTGGRGAAALTRFLDSEGIGVIRHYRRQPAARPPGHHDPVLQDLAQRRGQTPTQLAIVWGLQDPASRRFLITKRWTQPSGTAACRGCGPARGSADSQPVTCINAAVTLSLVAISYAGRTRMTSEGSKRRRTTNRRGSRSAYLRPPSCFCG